MIPIEIARLIGLILGPATALLLFALWKKYRAEGRLNLKMRGALLLMMGLFLSVVVSSYVEYNRAPIVKKVSYRMERPKAQGERATEPVRQKVRMTERGSTLSILGPVYERQLIGSILCLALLLIFTKYAQKQRENESVSVTAVATNKPLNIDRPTTLRSLRKLLDEDGVYKDPNLNLEYLSDRLSISRYQLSQLINEELNQNFYDLINEKRVEAAISQMNSGDSGHLTLSALGFEVGFNSKSSFYRAFKKKTGITPAAFRKQLS